MIHISKSIRDLFDKLIELFYSNLEYYKIVAFDIAVGLFSRLMYILIIVFSAFIVSFFLCFALASFIGEWTGHIYWGYLSVALIYGVLGMLVWINKVRWVINPIICMLTEMIDKIGKDISAHHLTKKETHD